MQNRMDALYERYLAASKKYVEMESANKDCIGILVSGSMKYGKIDKNSDIDIHVILGPECKYRERGNLWIDEIEIEYFKNPPIQIRSYFDKESKSPHTAHMFAHGEVVYKNSEIIDELKLEAEAIISKEPPGLKKFEIELEKYFIDDHFKDHEDAVINKDLIGSLLIRNKIIDRCIAILFKVQQVRRSKDKRLSDKIELLDPRFRKRVEMALKENWNEIRYLNDLRNGIDELLGGKRSRVWKLRSKLDL